jgi:predicted phosphodiesterase
MSMRVAVISDIHANRTALEAVLADAGDVDETWCLGDLVGYGPQPNECVEILRARAPHFVCIAGNHDRAALGRLDTGDFNHDASAAVLWTSQQLTPTNRSYLDTLLDVETSGRFYLAHGSPRHPIWEYVVSFSVARDNLALLPEETPYCLIGHSHLPLVFVEGAKPDDNPTVETPEPGTPFALGEKKLLINPGSVGQPRDGNPAASYLILDAEPLTVTYRRVAYNVEETQALMRERGLPERLAKRLTYGV